MGAHVGSSEGPRAGSSQVWDVYGATQEWHTRWGSIKGQDSIEGISFKHTRVDSHQVVAGCVPQTSLYAFFHSLQWEFVVGLPHRHTSLLEAMGALVHIEHKKNHSTSTSSVESLQILASSSAFLKTDTHLSPFNTNYTDTFYSDQKGCVCYLNSLA